MALRPKKSARLTLRVTEDTKATIRAAAERRDRTMNWLAQDILEKWATKERRHRGSR